MILKESKHYVRLQERRNRIQRFLGKRYVKPGVVVLTLILFTLSARYITLQMILQAALIVLGLGAIICKVPSRLILRVAFVTIVLIPVSNILGARDVATVVTIYAFLILCTGVLAAIFEEIRLEGSIQAKKSKKT